MAPHIITAGTFVGSAVWGMVKSSRAKTKAQQYEEAKNEAKRHMEKYMHSRRKEFCEGFNRPCEQKGDLLFEHIWSNDNPDQKLWTGGKTMEQYALDTKCITNTDINWFRDMFIDLQSDGQWDRAYDRKCKQEKCQEFRQKYPESEVGISLNHKPLVQLLLNSCETQTPNGWFKSSAPERLWHEFALDDMKHVEKKKQAYDKLVAQYGKHKSLAEYVGSESFAKGESIYHYALREETIVPVKLLVDHANHANEADTSTDVTASIAGVSFTIANVRAKEFPFYEMTAYLFFTSRSYLFDSHILFFLQ